MSWKNTTVLVGVALLGVLSVFAFTDLPPGGDVYLTITRVTTSETRSLDFLPTDGGWDLGDTASSITENYGGSAFEYGKSAQVEVYITAAPTGDEWDVLSLQYLIGTNSGLSTDWVTINTISEGFENITNVLGCHFGLSWTPPAATNYLLRIHGITTNGLENSRLDATGIDSKGDGLTWDNSEVVGFTITDNTRPGCR
jgi:hypothetical protein